MRLKIDLKKGFFSFFIFLMLTILLYVQYLYSKKNLIEKYRSVEYSKTIQIRDKFKSALNEVEFIFNSKLEENLKMLKLLYSLYKNIDSFDANKIASILNKKAKDKYGYYQVFVIDRNYKIIKASYKPDLGLDLGKFSKYRDIYKSIFNGSKNIDISYLVFDYSSFTLKRYFLILSPDRKYLLELAYVVDVYHKLKQIYYNFLLTNYRDLENIKLYFMDKYLVYPVNFNRRYQPKKPIEEVIKDTRCFFYHILNDVIRVNKLTDKEMCNLAKRVLDIFHHNNDLLSKLDLNKHQFVTYTLIEGFFKNLSNRLIIKNIFNTYSLEKDIEIIRNRFLVALISLIVILLFFEYIIFCTNRTIKEIVSHMKDNRPIKKRGFFIKELDELVANYNEYRDKLNKEIEKNKKLLLENKRFIIDTVHQLKTPLSIITLNSDYLKMHIKDEELKEILDEIEAAIAMFTNSYEDLAYLSSHKMIEYKPSNINISEVLKERIRFFTPLAKTRNKKLISEIDENIFFNINKVEFERLVDNNISNAIAYSNKETIEIKLKKEECIVLEFISYGDEIKDVKKIFEKNYREKEYKRGLGIGLNIVKNICQKYDIKYEVISKNGVNIFRYIFCYNYNKKRIDDTL